MRRTRHAIEQLRTAIDCLPVTTRVAMLEGDRSNEITVGACSAAFGSERLVRAYEEQLGHDARRREA